MVTFELTDQVRETIQQTLYQLLAMPATRSWAEFSARDAKGPDTPRVWCRLRLLDE